MGRPSPLSGRVEATGGSATLCHVARPGAAGGRPARSPCRRPPEPCGSGQLRPARDPAVQDPRQRAAGGRRRSDRRGPVVAVGQVARRLDELPGRHDPAAPRWSAPSPSAAVARSGGVQPVRPPGRRSPAPTARTPGRTTDAVPTHVTSRPPLSLLRITTSTRAPSSMSGSGCSSRRTPRTARRRPRRATPRARRPSGVAASQQTPVFFAELGDQRRAEGGPLRSWLMPRACQNHDPDNRCRAHPAPAGRRRRRGLAVRPADGRDGRPAAGDRVLAQRLRDGGARAGGRRPARDELSGLRGRSLGLVVASGAALALHFGTWVTSLTLTSVASATAIVCLQIAWVVAWQLLHGERFGVGVLAGLVLALAGRAGRLRRRLLGVPGGAAR